MRTCAAKRIVSIGAILLGVGVGVTGCAWGTKVFRERAGVPEAARALGTFLDRWYRWRSFAARVKVTVVTPHGRAAARGHVLYLLGERFEVGFAEPFDNLLGNVYVTPAQTIYWGSYGAPSVFGAGDTVRLPLLQRSGLPSWNPRDLLPFPVSARSAGFQTDSIWSDGEGTHIVGLCGRARHHLVLRRGLIRSEIVSRSGNDVVYKTYSAFKRVNGWPIATRVICADSSAKRRLVWSLADLTLERESARAPATLETPIGGDAP